MPGLEIYLNREKLCTAGVGGKGVVNAMVDVVSRNGEHDIGIRVGGLEKDEFLTWCTRALKVGDEIRIRLVEPDAFDPPAVRQPRTD
jgi:hypothetical protein